MNRSYQPHLLVSFCPLLIAPVLLMLLQEELLATYSCILELNVGFLPNIMLVDFEQAVSLKESI